MATIDRVIQKGANAVWLDGIQTVMDTVPPEEQWSVANKSCMCEGSQ